MALWGVVVFALGWLHLLRRGAFILLAALALVVVAAAARKPPWGSIPSSLRRLWRLHRVAVGWVAGSVILCVAGTINWPMSGDERDYKWSTPLAWARAGHFVEVDARLSNGFNLAEYLSTPAATFNTLAVARALNILVAIGIGLTAWALAREHGAEHGWVAAIGVGLSPIVLLGTTAVNSDLLPALLLGAAAVAGSSALTGRRTLLVPVLLGSAVLAKVIVIPVALVIAMWIAWKRGIGSWIRPSSRTRVAMTGACGVGLAVCVGALHTFALTGKFFAPKVKSIYPSDSGMVAAGAAAGRIPTLIDLLRLPIDPFIQPIIGQQEPYGGRTGLLLLVGLPFAIWILWTARKSLEEIPRGLAQLLILGGCTYVVLAPVFVKTRFLLVSWIALYAAVSVAIERAQRRPSFRRVTLVTVATAVALGSSLDPLRVALRHVV